MIALSCLGDVVVTMSPRIFKDVTAIVTVFIKHWAVFFLILAQMVKVAFLILAQMVKVDVAEILTMLSRINVIANLICMRFILMHRFTVNMASPITWLATNPCKSAITFYETHPWRGITDFDAIVSNEVNAECFIDDIASS